MTIRGEQIGALRLPLDRLPDPLPIPVVERPFNVTVRPPGSKSITNRALLLAALADGVSELRGALVDADDARVMIAAIERLGARVEVIRARSASEGLSKGPIDARDPREAGTTLAHSGQGGGTGALDVVRITGVGGRWKIAPGETVRLDLGNAGTATRFLAAAAVLAPAESGGVIIDGDARMRERPIGELGDALTRLGVRVEYLGEEGRPPVRVVPPADLRRLARRVVFSDPASSQFISAMMLVAPFLPAMLTIEMRGRIVSEPYIGMTWKLLERTLGVSATSTRGEGGVSMRMPVARGAGFVLDVEPDASGATYFAGAAALCRGARVVLPGLRLDEDESLQGDVEFLRMVRFMGAAVAGDASGTSVRAPPVGLKGIRGDFSPTPDTAMTAGVLACFASPTADNPAATSVLRGLRTLRVKETDRIEALRVELSKIGALVEVFAEDGDEGIRITPPGVMGTDHVEFETYKDHRMAMAMALVGLRRPNVWIRDPGCVAKTYPGFWRDLARLYESA